MTRVRVFAASLALVGCGAATPLDVDLPRGDGGARDAQADAPADAAKDSGRDSGKDAQPPDGGKCAPLYECPSGCRDLLTDVANCGGCDLPCQTAHATPKCAGGLCQIAQCGAGWGDCNASAQDGCEQDLTSDPQSCGACGKKCGMGEQCVNGVCGSSTCGNNALDNGERCDGSSCAICNPQVACFPPNGPNQCRWDFSKVAQLYCNGTCTWGGGQGCDQADADIFCKLKTGNPNATAKSFTTTTALAVGGFSCQAIGNYGTPLGPIPEYGVNIMTNGGVRYQATSILANHGAGAVIDSVVCQ